MRVLCATDLLFKSDAAVQRAGQLSDQLQADLSLIHVVVPGESNQALEQTLQWADSHLQARVRPPQWSARILPEVSVHTGSPARLILEAAHRLRARLLVLGPHRKRPLRDALEGTIAQKALATRSYPVLVVRTQAARPYRNVLLALDLSDASASAIRAAESLVLTPDSESTVVHAYPPPIQGMHVYSATGAESTKRNAHNWARAAQRSVRELLHCESGNPSRYDIHLEQRPAAAGILRAVERFTPDLLVMGTQGGGRLHRALIGSVANHVLHETLCDVLVAPEGSVGAVASRLELGSRRLVQARH
jgi:nucleotide-binding universal stress UspA family protein